MTDKLPERLGTGERLWRWVRAEDGAGGWIVGAAPQAAQKIAELAAGGVGVVALVRYGKGAAAMEAARAGAPKGVITLDAREIGRHIQIAKPRWAHMGQVIEAWAMRHRNSSGRWEILDHEPTRRESAGRHVACLAGGRWAQIKLPTGRPAGSKKVRAEPKKADAIIDSQGKPS